MKIIECFSIQVWDGGDRTNHKYYVASQEAADEWLAKHKFDVVTHREIIIFDDLAEIDEHINGEARKRAIAKLSREDMIALGIKE
jgi:hypothetical protein